MVVVTFMYLLLFTNYVQQVKAVCYFPLEHQGTFLIQTQASGAYGGNIVTYSEITVEADAIPPWGGCHRRRGNNIILKDSTGGEDCMRCFHITMNTPNVLLIHTEGLAKCYTKEEAARATCPNDRDVIERRFKEILLFRKQQIGSVSTVENLFCPINGRYRFTYTANKGGFRCDQPLSELGNCPNGNELGVRFRQCSFPEMDVSFLCLGDWAGPMGDRYLALMDLRENPDARPKYRCGLYRQDKTTGRVYVSFSADSTCTNQLASATDGYESLILTPLPNRSLPTQVETSRCKFPEWIQGQWEHIKVEGKIFTFRDSVHFQTVSARCIRRQNNTPNERYVVYTVTQCGDESYNCLWLKRRGVNVLEFQFGSQPSKQYSDTLCSDRQFRQETWITQGRINMAQISPCPITGDYTGVVPGTTTLCAKVASDCNNPDIMFYTVSNCEDRSHIYEEREYKCLGSWEENGILYTYTQRRDMHGFQCFSGKILQNGEEAYIKEAGESCIRGEDPLIYGMKIMKQASCPQLPPVTFVPVNPPWIPSTPSVARPPSRDPYWYQTEPEESTTKPWKPITRRPPPETTASANVSRYSSVIFAISAIFLAMAEHLLH
ncbi:uncharacterized protein LOC111630705 [Centruroides sculpturatus]|uniref:uncharacterized protein LOC111630705 n=1 Tax=Centruroides sculpturatus TaxID=218467 RepID=UPI000C6E6B1C|nr:uncharacterized protein LOC111630705 [Centruroides sculpturatus]